MKKNCKKEFEKIFLEGRYKCKKDEIFGIYFFFKFKFSS